MSTEPLEQDCSGSASHQDSLSVRERIFNKYGCAALGIALAGVAAAGCGAVAAVCGMISALVQNPYAPAIIVAEAIAILRLFHIIP